MDTDAFLHYLRDALADPNIAFTEPPAEVAGGFDTDIFTFRLNHTPSGFEGGLVLRMLRPHHDSARARYEAIVQNTLHDAGFPAAPVLLCAGLPEALGRPFVVMRHLPGATPFTAGSGAGLGRLRQALGLPRILAETQLRLHALDSRPLDAALAREWPPDGDPASPRPWTVEGQFARLGRSLDRGGLDGMRDGLAWLAAHKPPDPEHLAICHGDLHPLNMLMDGNEVTGVIDWSNAAIADPASDVGNTVVLLKLSPIEPEPTLGWLVEAVRRFVTRGYLRAYRAQRPIDDARLRYYEALRCFSSLTWSRELYVRRSRGEDIPPTPWDAPRALRRVAAHFEKISGVPLTLPGTLSDSSAQRHTLAINTTHEALGSPLHNVERGRG